MQRTPGSPEDAKISQIFTAGNRNKQAAATRFVFLRGKNGTELCRKIAAG